MKKRFWDFQNRFIFICLSFYLMLSEARDGNEDFASLGLYPSIIRRL